LYGTKRKQETAALGIFIATDTPFTPSAIEKAGSDKLRTNVQYLRLLQQLKTLRARY
jgi:hypothetical protein